MSVPCALSFNLFLVSRSLHCYISLMARDPKNFTGENVRAMLEASYRDERLREGNKLVGHFALVVVGVVAVVATLLIGLAQLFR